jgi:hypothetical protein
MMWRTLVMCSRPLTGGFAEGSSFHYAKNENAFCGVNWYSTHISTFAPTGTPALRTFKAPWSGVALFGCEPQHLPEADWVDRTRSKGTQSARGIAAK